MKTILLDGLYMNTKEATHIYLADRLQAPDYYGRNLDALYDILTDVCEPTLLILRRREHMLKSLGDYGETLLTVFRDAAEANGNLTFEEASDE